MSKQRAWAPHCDPSILHSPGACSYCDEYDDWQAYRQLARIAFSDEPPGADKAPCPSEHFRRKDLRDRWPGNTTRGYQ